MGEFSQQDTQRAVFDARAQATRPLDVFGIKENPPKARTPQEVARLKDRIAFIARVFARQYKMELYPSPSGGWACGVEESVYPKVEAYINGQTNTLDLEPEDLRPRRLYYDVKDIEGNMSEDEAVGVIRHEVGHANHTDYRLFFEGQRKAKEEGSMPSAWAFVWNSLEDPWVNNREIAGSESVRESLSALYRKWLPETRALINSQTPLRQLGLCVIHYWLTGDPIAEIKDKKVLETFERIRSAADQYIAAETAEESHRIMQEQVWPVVKPLVDEAQQQEEMKQKMREIAGGEKGGVQGAMDKLRNMLGIGKGKPSSGQSEADQALGEAIRQELERQQKSNAQAREKLKQEGAEQGRMQDDIDLNAVPEDLRKKLEEAMRQMSQADRKKLEDAARKALDKKMADAANESLPPGLRFEEDPKTGEQKLKMKQDDKKSGEEVKKAVDEHVAEQEMQEQKVSDETAKAEEERLAKIREEERKKRERAEIQKAGFDPDVEEDRDLYREFRALELAMESSVQRFMKIMELYLPKRGEMVHEGEYYTGNKLNKQSVLKRAPLGDYRLFRRRELKESNDPKMFVTLLIDNSGSMRGTKMEESRKTAIFFARVLQRFEIPFAIKAFGDQVEEVVSFDEIWDDPKVKAKPKLMRKTNASGGSTDMASGMLETMKEMIEAKREFPNCHGAVIVISDSGANAGPMVGKALGEYVSKQQKTYTVVNLLLSGSSHDIASSKEIFGERHVAVAGDFHELPEQAFRLLRTVLQRVLKSNTLETF